MMLETSQRPLTLAQSSSQTHLKNNPVKRPRIKPGPLGNESLPLNSRVRSVALPVCSR